MPPTGTARHVRRHFADNDPLAFGKLGATHLRLRSVRQPNRHRDRPDRGHLAGPRGCRARLRAAAPSLRWAGGGVGPPGKTWRDLAGQWGPTQRGIGDLQHILPAARFELRIGRQVGQQFAIGIVGVHLDRVGDDVLGHRRVEPNLADAPVEHPVGKRVHGEGHRLSGINAADVGLVHRGPDLDALEVFGDEEQARCAQAGDDRLADVDAPVNDHALHGGGDGAIAEVLLRLGQRGFGLRQRRLGLIHGGLGHPRLAFATS